MKRAPESMTDQPNKKEKLATTLTFVTGNQGKLREVTRILKEDANFSDFNLVNVDIDLPELQGTPEEIASKKVEAALLKVSGPVFVEDVCLCYNALGGMPGPYIKWFMKGTGVPGLSKVLDGFEDKSAYALCIIAYSQGEGHPIKTFAGRVDGLIVPPRGSQGFGWDPVFQPIESEGKTFAEMSDSEKDTISHRRRAVELFRNHLKETL